MRKNPRKRIDRASDAGCPTESRASTVSSIRALAAACLVCAATVGLSSLATAGAQEPRKAADQATPSQPGTGQQGGRGSTLTLIDTGESKASPVSINSEAFRQRVSLQIETPKAGVVLRVEASPLSGPDGVSAELSATMLGRTGRSIDAPIEASTSVEVFDIELSATLTRAGEYSGYVLLRYGDERPIIKPLRVNRAMVDAPVEPPCVADPTLIVVPTSIEAPGKKFRRICVT